MSAIRKINVPGVGRLPAFCHATVAGNQVFVSGMLGAREGALELVPGGIAAQTTQALRNIQVILAACGCELSDVAKVNVYLTDMASFGEMNEPYLKPLLKTLAPRVLAKSGKTYAWKAVPAQASFEVAPEIAGDPPGLLER